MSSKRITNPPPFPVLELFEIRAVLQSVGIDVVDDMLQRPTSPFTVALLEQLVSTWLCLPPHDLRLGLDAAAARVDPALAASPQLADTRYLLGLTAQVGQWLRMCGFEDFSTLDLVKPEPARLRRQLSALINFARFREDRMTDPGSERLFLRLTKTLKARRVERRTQRRLKRSIEELDAKLRAVGRSEHSLDDHNNAARAELVAMRRVEDELLAERERYVETKRRLAEALNAAAVSLDALRHDNDRMAAFVAAKPGSLTRAIDDLNAQLATRSATRDSLETNLGQLEQRLDQFRALEKDVGLCLRGLEAIETQRLRLDEARARRSQLSEEVADSRATIEEYEHQVEQLGKQLESVAHRLQQTRSQYEADAEARRQHLADLHTAYAEKTAVQKVNNQAIEMNRGMVADKQAQIGQVRRDMEANRASMEDGMARLQAAVHDYMKRMSLEYERALH